MRTVLTCVFLILAILGSQGAVAKEEEERGWIGVNVRPVNEAELEELGLEEVRGVMLLRVIPESPAEAAGLREGDVILRVGEVEISGLEGLMKTMAATRIGQRIVFLVLREKEREKFELTLGPRPAEFEEGAGEREGGSEMERRAAHMQELEAARRHIEEAIAESTEGAIAAAAAGRKDEARELIQRVRELTVRMIHLDREAEELAGLHEEGAERERAGDEERRAARHEMELLRAAMEAFMEAEQGNAAERVEHAIHARELRLEGERSEEVKRVIGSAPGRPELAKLLMAASSLWKKFGEPDTAEALQDLARRYSGGEREERRAGGEERLDDLQRQVREMMEMLDRLAKEIEELRHKRR